VKDAGRKREDAPIKKEKHPANAKKTTRAISGNRVQREQKGRIEYLKRNGRQPSEVADRNRWKTTVQALIKTTLLNS